MPDGGPVSRRDGGLSLIELMIAMALVAIVLGLGVPAFSSTLAGHRLNTVGNDLAAAAQMARSEAVKRNRSITLCRTVSPADTACIAPPVPDDRWAHWIVFDTASTVLRQGSAADSGNTRVRSSYGNHSVAFASSGLPLTNGSITVCTPDRQSDNQRVINIGPGSRIAVTRNTGGCL